MSEDEKNNDIMAQRIKELRTRNNLSQEQLAEMLGLQKSAIAKYENGRVINIKRSTIATMAEIFHCSPSYIMGWEYYDSLDEYEKESTKNKLASFYEDFSHDEMRNIILFLEDILDLPEESRKRMIRLLTYCRKLNSINGVPEAEKRIEELTLIPKYWNKAYDDKFIQHIEALRTEPIAAHANESATPEENKFDDDIMDDDSEWE